MDFRTEWNKSVVRVGRVTMLLAICCSFLPNLILSLFYGAAPSVGDLLVGWGQIAAAYGAFYVIEPITYYTVLGTAGSYMGILAGSMGQMRVPAAATALDVTNNEAGSDKGEIISTMGIAGSIVTNITILTIFVVFGYQILGVLPQTAKNAISNLILPALFGAVLMRMYQRYAERHNFKYELIDIAETEMGGIKEATFSLNGRGAYSRMKYESGVHRVQRVPETETQGRIHTSAATVAVLPEAEDIDVEINPGDLRIDTYRSSGAGGQHVNKTESAIRITHLPTGLVVQSQDERSQGRNKEQAMKVLKSRLYEMYRAEAAAKEASARKSQVGSGDRSERIRTYNFPQGRVTDHRIGMTIYKLPQFIDGDMDEIIEGLILAERTKQLAGEDAE